MKKILSLMCALWACILMGFAMEVTVPGAVLDLQNPTTVTTAGWTGEIAYYLDNKVLVVSGNESYRSVGKQTWISQVNVGSTSATWSKEPPFKGSDYYTNANAATVNTAEARNIAYLITGCDSVWCYGYNNSATCYLAMNIYDLTGAPVATINDATAEKVFGLDNAAAGGKASGIMKQALDASKTYLVELWGTGSSSSRVFEVAFFRHPKAAEMKTIYCKMEHNWWTKDGAAIAAYAWKEGGEANAELFPGERMTAVEGQSGLWKIELDVAKFTQVIFTRVNASGELQNWGAQTEDLTIPTDDKDLFTITNTTETWAGLGQKCTGEWSKYDPSSTPVDPPTDVKFYITGSGNLVGTDKEWNPAAIEVKSDAYVFENLAAGDYKMKITLDGQWKTAKGFDDLTDKPAGITPDDDRNICFTLAEPSNVTVTYTDAAFTVEGNFYVKPDDPPVDPGDKVAIRLVPGVWNKDGAKFACLTTNEGTAATVDITSLAMKAVISDWFVGGDTVVGQIPADTKVIAFGRLDPATPDLTIMSIMTYLWNHSDILDLDESLIYTIDDWGTGDYSPGHWGEGSVTPPVEGFYITGSANLVGADKEWHADAIKVDGTSYTFKNLAAGDYLMKITLDGQWETGTAKGFSALTVTPEGVKTDKDDNICFTLAEIGDVTVTYTGAVFTVEGNFYVKPDDPPVDPGDKVAIRLVPGVWNKDGAKFACLTTNEGTAATVDITSLAMKAVISDWFVGGDTVVGQIPADTKVIAFGRLDPATPDLTIMSIMTYLWNHSDILDLDESLIYTIDDWGTGDYSPGHWGEGSVDPETKEIRLVPGSWASDNAIFAAWAWAQGKEGTWSVFQNSGETLRANISAAADSILFVRFNEKVTAPEWDANLIAYKTADFKIEDCGLFYFDDQTWCNPATPDENDFYITGDEALVGQDNAWNPAAIPVKGTSYTFANLSAGSYKLKVTENGKWTTAKGYGDLTTVAENLSKDKSDNVCFTLGEAGDVVVTYTATVFTVAGKFVTPPEPQKVEIRLVPGVWNLDGAKFAAVTFTEMPAEMNAEALANAVISDWFVGVDTVVGLIPEDAKVIGFGRFNPETTELTLMNVMAEGTMWNHSDIMYIDESMIYTITGWPEEGKDVCPGYWGNNAGEGIEDIDASVKAVKIVHNGQVLILRGEHIYTVMGQEVK